MKEDSVKLERVDSAHADITRAYLQRAETGMVLRGDLRGRLITQRFVPGHLHIELIDYDGKTFKQASIRQAYERQVEC